jgi:magnesium-transporting ATPase (P-type)
MAVVTLTAVVIMARQGYESPYIQTVAFLMLIVAQWMNAFNARSELKSSFSRLKKMNYGLMVGLVIAVFLQALVMFGPLGYVFDIQNIPISVLAITSGVMAVAILSVSELHKLLVRKSNTKVT